MAAGVTFLFSNGEVTSLEPGELAVVANVAQKRLQLQ
jgi:hypothetical protein